MQISCRCQHCGHMHVSKHDEDLAVEIDFYDGVMRFICKSCKKESLIRISDGRAKRDQPLPRIVITR